MNNIGNLIEKYVEIRDNLAEKRREFKKIEVDIKSDLEKIEVEILEFQNKIGVTSISSTVGTAYKIKKEYYAMKDWNKFIEFVVNTKNYQMLEKRVAKIATKEVLTEKDLAPAEIGVDYSSEYCIQIRKK